MNEVWRDCGKFRLLVHVHFNLGSRLEIAHCIIIIDVIGQSLRPELDVRIVRHLTVYV